MPAGPVVPEHFRLYKSSKDSESIVKHLCDGHSFEYWMTRSNRSDFCFVTPSGNSERIHSMASDEIAGLGLAIEVSNQGQCRVLHTIVGGSAHGCGKISPGDFLLAVLDRERSAEYLLTSGLDFNEVKSLIAGRRGTKVTLKMQHQDSFEENSGEIYLCEDLIRSPIQAPQLPVRATLDSFSPFSPLEMVCHSNL
jgi:C-terminal processing protease CtpA/Prc